MADTIGGLTAAFAISAALSKTPEEQGLFHRCVDARGSHVHNGLGSVELSGGG